MARIRVSTLVDAPPATVWAAVADIGSHVTWMADAESITFTSESTSGPGTTFDCVTRVGPVRLVDHMVVTTWSPGRRMGVRHVGLVRGSGTFTLRPRRGRGRRARRTRFVWSESLRFPWWMGGPFGAWAATPVFVWIWRGNLRRLRELVEQGPDA